MSIEQSQIRLLRARLEKTEKALFKIRDIDARGAVDSGKTWQERRDVAYNALERAKGIALEGLCP